MKATEQYFPVMLSFTMPYKLVLTFEPVDEILIRSATIQTKATEHCFPVVLFIMLSVHEILTLDHSNESY